MALSQKHRIALYAHFKPHLGDDVTEAFLAEFPARDDDELVTRSFLRAELADLRTELRGEIADLRGELHTGLADLRGELRAEMHQLHNRTITILIAAMAVMTAVLSLTS